MQQLVVLDEDKAWARERIAVLEAEIQALGPEFYDVFNQSSETWHDNAPFDALRDRQSVLDAERQQLKLILRSALPKAPHQWRDRVGIGSKVVTRDEKGNERGYFIAGDWTPRAGRRADEAVIVSAKAPIAQVLLGARKDEVVVFHEQPLRVIAFIKTST